MSSTSNTSPTEFCPFSAYLNDAAEAAPHSTLLIPPSRGNTTLRTAASHLRAAVISGWRWLQQSRISRSATRRLRVAETISLGEKRFVSIIQVDDAQFLIGSSGTGVQLLAQLQSNSALATPAKLTTQEVA